MSLVPPAEFSLPEDEYFNGATDDSSGMSSYDEDDEADLSLSRKTSGGSNASKASSGVDADVGPLPPRRPPRKKKSKDGAPVARIPLAHCEDFDDFDDEEEEEDAEAVKQLLQTLKEEAGQGPASSLLTSLGFEPRK